MEQLRTLNHTLLPFFTLYMLLKLKLTKMMQVIIFIWFIGLTRFWLFSKGLIYNFIERSPQNVDFINQQINYNLSIIINFLMIIIEVYCLNFVFSNV